MKPPAGNRTAAGLKPRAPRKPRSTGKNWIPLIVVLLAAGGAGFWLARKMVRPAGPQVASSPAADMPPMTGKLAAGAAHVLALDGDGLLHAWGNVVNQDEASTQRRFDLPSRNNSDQHWKEIRVGTLATYALQESGVLWRIAPNLKVRNGSNEHRFVDVAKSLEVPLFFPEFRWRKAMEMWGIGAGIDTEGRLWYWLDEDLKNVGNVFATGSHGTPQAVGEEQGFSDFCLTGARIYAVDQDGALWRTGDLTPWRKNRGLTLPGPEDTGAPESLRPIPAPAKLAKVFCTNSTMNVFAIDQSGGLWAFGPNGLNVLGDGEDQPVPETAMRHIGDQRWTTIALNDASAFGIMQDGSLWGWGRNYDGELGVGDRNNRNRPSLINDTHRWVDVAAGARSAAALTDRGEIYTWGNNANGTLGDGMAAETRLTPTKIFSDVVFAKPTP